ncbi:MarR family winged helix-turn-helix transcriptional regulator [Streptomyces sp. NPDC014861]|uniref:MarR family winged helix-turn-helix transcriptional regulator n=1 Tax=Streptomyces sp. NPDC014861 TaxID=3364923 RepID=UPI0036FA4F15
MTNRHQDLLHLLTRAERLSARRLQTVLGAFDCSLEAWRVLDLLADGQGHTMTALAEHAFLPAPTLTRLVDQLVDQNLVYRRADPADRRRVLAALTPRGVEHRQLLSRAVDADREAWAAPLAEADEAHLAELLRRLTGVLGGRDAVTAAGAERGAGRAR